jgi:hypothetical protein
VPAESLIDRAADELARRRSRRGFLGVTAKITVAVATGFLGLAGFSTQAKAWSWHCCNFSDNCSNPPCTWCTSCPNCPSGTVETYVWQCCEGGCQWTCKDCTQRIGGDCACGWLVGVGGCGGPCLNLPTKK